MAAGIIGHSWLLGRQYLAHCPQEQLGLFVVHPVPCGPYRVQVLLPQLRVVLSEHLQLWGSDVV